MGDDTYERLDDIMQQRYGVGFNPDTEEDLMRFFTRLADQFGEDELLTAWGMACAQYADPIAAFSKLKGILFNRRRFTSFIDS